MLSMKNEEQLVKG